MEPEPVRECGATMHRVDRLTSGSGFSSHVPYLDDRVVGLALSIGPADRAAATPYQPPSAVAMRGIVPEHLPGRQTRADLGAEATGPRRHKHELVEHRDALRLARLGAVDPEKLRVALLGPHPAAPTIIPLDATPAGGFRMCPLPDHASVTTSPGGPR
ncbi:asparagine synthase-related protein [Embleya hyalina]|nr:asparagine synthase-related protein [Embleya hyalina]